MNDPISSLDNERLRWLRRLTADRRLRRREGLWVTEGVRLAEEVVASGLAPRLWVWEEGWEEKGPREAGLAAGVVQRREPLVRTRRGLLRELTTTHTPQGICVAFAAPASQVADLAIGDGPVVVLDQLQDPGNLGTIARVALGAGAAGLALTPGAADPGNPKALRASAGALLRLPVVRIAKAAEWLATLGLPVLSTSGAAGVPYERLGLGGRFVLLLGQEGAGLSPELAALATAQVTIPMAGGLESLNVASAAAVLLFEAARQRRGAAGGKPPGSA